ncbi:MAG TPA: hypothetical protein VN734_05380 [Acidobacteriaceae bacterium]|nr:hypothetical protein [Acidobacteriaceae bacterium]
MTFIPLTRHATFMMMARHSYRSPVEQEGIPLAYLKVAALALFGVAVTMKFVYIVVKTVRITVLKVDLPMAGFDSEPETEAVIPEEPAVHEVAVHDLPVREAPAMGELPAG